MTQRVFKFLEFLRYDTITYVIKVQYLDHGHDLNDRQLKYKYNILETSNIDSVVTLQPNLEMVERNSLVKNAKIN